MFDDGNVNHTILPITALAFVTLKSRLLLLAGEGPYLKVFDHGTAQLLAVKQVFESQAIHGLTFSKGYGSEDEEKDAVLLIWGGRCLCTCEICEIQNGQLKVDVRFGRELKADDWILDTRFRPCPHAFDPYASVVEGIAVLITAHNVALTLDSDGAQAPFLKRITAGPRSMLYSACIEWTLEEKILVASGTVFGEVLLWSFSERALFADDGILAVSQLHHSFTGHEGSVFGVRISPKLPDVYSKDEKRLLASCSDDRTIRIWDVSALENNVASPVGKRMNKVVSEAPSDGLKDGLSESRCIATIMGHASRIWNVRFHISKKRISVLSFGEDSTAQLWELVQEPKIPGLATQKVAGQYLIHQQTYAYHSGKNIWASAVLERKRGPSTICTGGADGRVVLYDLDRGNQRPDGKAPPTSWSMEDVAVQLKVKTPDGPVDRQDLKNKDVPSKHIFESFEGQWTIERYIESALPTYPSGIFRGEATFERRSPSSNDFDEEYLYTEQGTFNAHQGLSFAATRQYVYRYERASDTVSAWFVKPDDRSSVDYLFHELGLEGTNDSNGEHNLEEMSIVKASGYHLCVDDHYSPVYIFHFQNNILRDWSLAYQAKGPQKDYVAEASYTRKTSTLGESKVLSSEETISRTIQTQNKPKYMSIIDGLESDHFKSYVWLTHGIFMVTTAQGRVIIASLMSGCGRQRELRQSGKMASELRWDMVGRFESLKSSSIMMRATPTEAVFISGNDGTIFIYDHRAKGISPIVELARKVAFLHAQKLNNEVHIVFATCLGMRVAHVTLYKKSDFRGPSDEPHPRTSLLALPDSVIVTSACYIEASQIWILGSRTGTMALYDNTSLSTEAVSEPSKLLPDVHGKDAITVIHCLPDQKADQPVHILTAGRDGHYAIHTLITYRGTSNQLEVTLTTVHRSTTPFGPNIEGAAFDPESQSLLLWGFRSKHFVVWNATKQMEAMTIECGGVHRNWSYMPRLDGGDGGSFVWTKASICHMHSQVKASHRVFQSGGHGREIKAMALSPAFGGSSEQYIATGAEDTAIRIWSIDPETGFKCRGTFTKHTTGIQQLRWSNDGNILFSAAGCEELFAWRVQTVPFIGIGAVCEAVCPPVTEERDLRIMDFCIEDAPPTFQQDSKDSKSYSISAVYSDSSLRVSHPLKSITQNTNPI
ncbi:MAG: hypothetical protein Q9170_007517 [Blastenia crenularia]